MLASFWKKVPYQTILLEIDQTCLMCSFTSECYGTLNQQMNTTLPIYKFLIELNAFGESITYNYLLLIHLKIVVIDLEINIKDLRIKMNAMN